MTRASTFHGIDFDQLAEAWRRFYPARFAVSPRLIRANTVEHPCLDWGCSLATVRDGRVSSFIAVKKSAAPHLFRGPDPDQAHITALAFEDPVEMVDLFAQVKSSLRQRGVYRLVFGADHAHFFPGIPEECTHLRNFLEVEGFSVDDSRPQYDLERDLIDYEVPEWIRPALETVTIRRANSADIDATRGFLDATFPGRWKHDVMKRMEEHGRPQDVFLMLEGEEVIGFAFTQCESDAIPIAGAVWCQSLGEGWGTLGPIGIGQASRGKKLGHAMLGGALKGLHDSGTRRCLIDWTTLVDFYGAHGFEVTRAYRSATLDLSR